MERAFYNKENLDPQMHEKEDDKSMIPEGVDAELLMKMLENPEMAKLLASLAKTINA